MSLYPWQEKVISEAPDNPRRALFAAPRLGKTKASAIMLECQDLDRSLIVAPLSVCGAWCAELALQGLEVHPLYQRGIVDAARFLIGAERASVHVSKALVECKACSVLKLDVRNLPGSNYTAMQEREIRSILGLNDAVSIMPISALETPNHIPIKPESSKTDTSASKSMVGGSQNIDLSWPESSDETSFLERVSITKTANETTIDLTILNFGSDPFDPGSVPQTSHVRTVHEHTCRQIRYDRPSGCVVLNYDKIPGLESPLKSWKPQGQVYDESHLLKNPQSSRSKVARRLAARANFVRILTGTPSPNHYGDLWAQLTLVNPGSWGKSHTEFARRFLIRHAIYPSKIIGYNNLDELRAMIVADSDIIRREDVFGPDTYQYVERLVEMPRAAREAYDTLVREWLYYLDTGGEVLADHTLTRLVRLQQLASGYLHTSDGQDITMHTAKIDAVMADLDEILESQERAVIFHRFTWEGDAYAAAIHARYASLKLGRIHGDVSASGRTDAETALRTGESPILIAQTRTAALGVSFAEATHALFVSQSFSFTDEDQARDRVYKPGFNRCVTFYRTRGTVDQFIAQVLAAKSGVHAAVTHADVRAMAYGR